MRRHYMQSERGRINKIATKARESETHGDGYPYGTSTDPRWYSNQGDRLFLRTVMCDGGTNAEPNTAWAWVMYSLPKRLQNPTDPDPVTRRGILLARVAFDNDD